MRYFPLIMILFTFTMYGAEDEDKPKLTPTIETAQDRYKAAVAKAEAEYLDTVNKEREKLDRTYEKEITRITKKGDLEMANALVAAQKTFHDEIPITDFMGQPIKPDAGKGGGDPQGWLYGTWKGAGRSFTFDKEGKASAGSWAVVEDEVIWSVAGYNYTFSYDKENDEMVAVDAKKDVKILYRRVKEEPNE